MMNLHPISKDRLRPGYILLYEKTTIVARIEQIFTLSEFNHVSIIDPEGLVNEAIIKGFVERPIDESIDKYTKRVVVLIPNYDFDVEVLKQALLEMRGKKYDFISLWYHIKRSLFGGWKGSTTSNRIICSELVGEVLAKLGVEYYKDKWFKISPSDFFKDRINFEAYSLDLTVNNYVK